MADGVVARLSVRNHIDLTIDQNEKTPFRGVFFCWRSTSLHQVCRVRSGLSSSKSQTGALPQKPLGYSLAFVLNELVGLLTANPNIRGVCDVQER